MLQLSHPDSQNFPFWLIQLLVSLLSQIQKLFFQTGPIHVGPFQILDLGFTSYWHRKITRNSQNPSLPVGNHSGKCKFISMVFFFYNLFFHENFTRRVSFVCVVLFSHEDFCLFYRWFAANLTNKS